jgi:ABC-2 type transport system ATP-binding protein
MSDVPLQLKKLTKHYGKYQGIEDVDLVIKPGEVFGFLGPNGAGKSTTIRTIMNFLRPSSGSAQVFGLDSVNDSTAIKSRVGYLAGDFEMYENLTGRQYLTFIANLRGEKNSNEQIKHFATVLEAQLGKKLGKLSRGNMQKIALIAALLHDPDLLILDEPTTGLDPLMQNQFYELMKERTNRGKTVFMSSHILSEVQTICDRVAFMKEGALVEVIDVNKLRASRKKEVRLVTESTAEAIQVPDFKDLEIITHTKTELRFVTSETGKELLRWMSTQDADDATIQDVSLEDMFLKLYGVHMEEHDV